jgi:hypothetical protein
MSHYSGAIPELHLAVEAIVAHVDGELAPVPRDRANAHLAKCPECRAAVAEQRRAKAALTVAAGPSPSSDLLARLRDIPMTTDLVDPGVVLAVQNDELVWGTAASMAPRGRAKRAERTERKTRNRPAGLSRPQSRARHSSQAHRISRGFAGVAAAAVVGMLAASATTSSGGSAAPSRQVSPAAQQTGTAPGSSTSIPGNAQLVANTTPLFVQRPARVLPVVAQPGR